MFKTSRLERAGFAARRSVVMARNGMVATSQPLATEAGVAILKKGGNAFDAAIATALTLGVVEPMSCGMGGDLFALYWDAKTGRLTGLNSSGWAPKGLTVEFLKGKNFYSMPQDGIQSVTAPGLSSTQLTCRTGKSIAGQSVRNISVMNPLRVMTLPSSRI